MSTITRFSIITRCWLLLPVLLVSCATSAAAPPPTAAPAARVVPMLAASEMLPGLSRFPLGLISNGSPVNDPGARVRVAFFKLVQGQAQAFGAEQPATYFGAGLPAGVYVTYPTFDQPGDWIAEVRAQLSGQAALGVSRLRFTVAPTSSTLRVGDQGVAVKTPTLHDAPLNQITSAPAPDQALYQLSLDQALLNGKPTALLFATPGFCATATCGPSYEVVSKLRERFGARANFIHVEIYAYPFAEAFNAHRLAPPMAAWRLTTEPWLFLLDGQGKVAARYEGGITGEEVTPALERLLAGKPPLAP